jgi:hypothetical protein
MYLQVIGEADTYRSLPISPRCPMPAARHCKLCSHGDRAKIDRLILSGISATDLVTLYHNEFGSGTVYNHKKHMAVNPRDLVQQADAIALETPQVPTDVPDNLLEWGLLKLLANICSLEEITRATGNIRASEVLTASLGRLLDYEKTLRERSEPEDSTVEIRVTRAMATPYPSEP